MSGGPVEVLRYRTKKLLEKYKNRTFGEIRKELGISKGISEKMNHNQEECQKILLEEL